MLVTDSGLNLVFTNPAYVDVCECMLNMQVMAPHHLFSHIPDAAKPIYRLVQSARKGVAHAEDIRFSVPGLQADASRWFKIKVQPLHTTEESLYLWSVSDATKEKSEEENIFQTLQETVSFIDDAPAGFFSSTISGQITFLNKTLANWLGYDPNRLDDVTLTLDRIIVNKADVLILKIQGAPGERRTDVIDLDLRCKNNKILPARLMHQVIFGADGMMRFSNTIVFNRSLNSDVDTLLRALEVKFARFFNSSPIGIATFDVDGNILESNAAYASFVPSPAQLSNEKALQFHSLLSGLSPQDSDNIKRLIGEAINNRINLNPVDVVYDVGSAKKYARIYVSPYDAENTNGIIAYVMDLNENRKLQEDFEQSQKISAVGMLAGGIAHDFNNMLTAIIGYSDLLLVNFRSTDPVFKDILQIKSAANRAAILTRQLLSFSRRHTSHMQVLNLGEALSELQIFLHRYAGEKITLTFRFERDLWLVKADLIQFEQIITNLVVNARDAISKPKGQILIRTANITEKDCANYNSQFLSPSEYVLIEVEDNGSGIPADIQEKIFEPFFTTKDIGKGTGLGLSTVVGIVKQFGGCLLLDSIVGRGTIFRIFIPRYIPDQNEQPLNNSITSSINDYTGQGIILLVEDEDAVRTFAARSLSARGFTVHEATTGQEAIELIERLDKKVDLIISDVNMPEMDGLSMYHHLRDIGVNTTIIFTSGYADELLSEELTDGNFDFLTKPFANKALIEMVKTHLASSVSQ